MLYDAFHRIEPVSPRPEPVVVCDVVGPLCETSDTLGKDRRLPRPEPGDLFAVLDPGAEHVAHALETKPLIDCVGQIARFVDLAPVDQNIEIGEVRKDSLCPAANLRSSSTSTVNASIAIS